METEKYAEITWKNARKCGNYGGYFAVIFKAKSLGKYRPEGEKKKKQPLLFGIKKATKFHLLFILE